jgi:hypothetical protein
VTWYGLKEAVARLFPITHDAMHVHVGLAIFLLSALLLRRHRYGMVLAWLATLSLEIVNEGLDARDWILWTGHVNWPETGRDMVDTLLWPSILLAALCGAGGARLPLADIGGLQRTRPESPRSARTSAVTVPARPRSPRDSAR